MKKSILLALVILLQSCQVYKGVSVSEVEVGKQYEVVLKDGRTLEAVCEQITPETLFLRFNDNQVAIPKSEIASAKKQKVSVLRVVTGVALATAGVVVILVNAGDEPVPKFTLGKN